MSGNYNSTFVWVSVMYISFQYRGDCMVGQEFSEYRYLHSQWNYLMTYLRSSVCILTLQIGLL